MNDPINRINLICVLYTVNGLHAKYEANATSKPLKLTNLHVISCLLNMYRNLGKNYMFWFYGGVVLCQNFLADGDSHALRLSARAPSARSFPIIFMFIMFVHGK